MIDENIYKMLNDLNDDYRGSITCSNINEDFFDALCCDYFDIYFVNFKFFETIDFNEVPERVILLPNKYVLEDVLYKINDKYFKRCIYKDIKDDLSKYRGKKK